MLNRNLPITLFFKRAFSVQLKDPSLYKQKALINGNWVSAINGKTYTLRNPANEENLGQIPDMDANDTRVAIQAASDAFPAWRARTAKDRSQLLRKLFDAVSNNAEDLAYMMTLENGKPLAESKGEVTYANGFLEWFAEEAKRTNGDVIPTPFSGRRLLAVRQPVGVVGMITPWNFPLAMITRKVGPALAAGCTVVLKPAEFTPLSALALCELSQQVGIPPGVINIVTSSRQNAAAIGTELTTNPIVRKISFTGSTGIGKLLMKQCSSTVKRVSLELGGNAPFIVFEDADLDQAVAGAIAAKFRNTGQTCVCANRILVHTNIYDVFAQKMAEKVAAMKVGNGLEEGVVQGPLIHKNAAERVNNLVVDALSKGAKAIVGGGKHSLGFSFFQPTVLIDVDNTMSMTKEEIFGPVAPLMRFSSEEEAIRLANDSTVGLSGYFYTKDVSRIWRVAEALEVGIVGVNEGIISTEVAPFGGVKESGIGREGSTHGINEYMDMKYICWGGLNEKSVE